MSDVSKGIPAKEDIRAACEQRLRALLVGTPRSSLQKWGVLPGFADTGDIVVAVGNVGDSRDGVDAAFLGSVVTAAIERDLLKSVIDCARGGIALAIARSCRASGLGCYVVPDYSVDTEDELFEDASCCVICSVTPSKVEVLADLLDDVDMPYASLGQVGGDRLVVEFLAQRRLVMDIPVDEL